MVTGPTTGRYVNRWRKCGPIQPVHPATTSRVGTVRAGRLQRRLRSNRDPTTRKHGNRHQFYTVHDQIKTHTYICIIRPTNIQIQVRYIHIFNNNDDITYKFHSNLTDDVYKICSNYNCIEIMCNILSLFACK